MHWLDEKYVLEISPVLDKFKKKGNVYNFRCPICLDSKKSKKKTRAYIISKGTKTTFFCHNCGSSMHLSQFIQTVRPELYSQYVMDKIEDENLFKAEEIKYEPPKEIDLDGVFKGLKKVSQLNLDHPVRRYIGNRQIPPRFHYKILFCPKFKTWVNSILPNKFEDITIDEPRLLFVLFDQNKKPFGVNARALTKHTEPKYITIKFNEAMPKIFGLESIDPSKDIFVFEGPIDSMMISNAIAVCGGSLIHEIEQLGMDKSKFVLVFDNEPRKKETINHIDKAIKMGYRVCLLPDIAAKDANQLIAKEGWTPLKYKQLLKDNIFEGIEAELKFAYWRKC